MSDAACLLGSCVVHRGNGVGVIPSESPDVDFHTQLNYSVY